MLKKFLVVSTLISLALASQACNKNADDPYGNSTDPLPDRATLLANDEYTKLAAQTNFYPIGAREIQLQEQRRARDLARDERVIAQYLRAHPQMPVPSDPTERGVVESGDGSFRHVIPRKDGTEMTVTTQSQAWSKATLADAIRNYPTRANQLANYRFLYGALSADARRDPALPAPETIDRLTRRYPASVIEALVDHASELIRSNPDALAVVRPSDLVAPASCALEEGYVDGSDRTGSPEGNPACAPAPNGIHENFAFANRSSLTCVKNQANRGACVSFAMSSALESLVAKASGRFVSLSEQELYHQAKLAWYRADYGDGLSTASVAITMSTQSWPLPLETAWLYNPAYGREDQAATKRYAHSCDGYDGACSDGSHQGALFCTDKAPSRYCGYLGRPKADVGFRLSTSSQLWNSGDVNKSLNRMVAAVQAGGAVVWGFSVTESFDAAAGTGYALYQGNKETNRGGHAVHAVGAIDNATLARVLPSAPAGAGGGYLIVKNSWSTCWGDGGFVYVPYDFVRAYTLDVTQLQMASN